MSAKETALELIGSLPDDCSWQDIQYRVFVRTKIEEGLEDSRQGRVVPHEEVLRMVEQWAASSGQTQP